MSVALVLLVILVILIAIVVIAASQLSTAFSVSQTLVINRPVEQVFDYVRLLRHADRYNKWTMLDPQVKRSYLGTDGTPGFVAAWESDMKQVGKGEQEIISVTEDRRIDWALRFEKPFRNEATSFMTTEPVSEATTKVTWVFGGTRNLAMKVFHLLFNLPKVLGRDLGESLRNLKVVLES